MLKNKKFVMVSGASRGIGLEITRSFLELGKNVILLARNEDRLVSICKELKQEFPQQDILYFALDLSDVHQVHDMSQHLFRNSDLQIEVLVNNAGSFKAGRLLEEEEGQLLEMISANLLSAYHLTRAIVPNMIHNKLGHIFHMSSIAGVEAYSNGASYGISKYALEGFIANLRLELKDKGVKVTNVISGPVWTDSWKSSGIKADQLISTLDIGKSIITAYQLSENATIENIKINLQRAL